VSQSSGSEQSEDQGGFNYTFFRLARLLRLSRIFRAFRIMRFFRELRLLLNLIYSSMKTLMWCLILLFILAYAFSVILMYGATGYLQAHLDCQAQISGMREYSHYQLDRGWDDLPFDCQISMILIKDWGGLGRAMLTLMGSVSGGEDWAVLADTLVHLDGPFHLIFVVYIIVVTLCLMNCFIGAYVETALHSKEKDKEGVILDELDHILKRDEDFVKIYQVIAHSIDADHNGKVSREEFLKKLESPVVQAYFASLGVKIWDPNEFYDELNFLGCKDKKGMDVDKFIEGCMRQCSPATAAGSCYIEKRTKEITHRVDRIWEKLECMTDAFRRAGIPVEEQQRNSELSSY